MRGVGGKKERTSGGMRPVKSLRNQVVDVMRKVAIWIGGRRIGRMRGSGLRYVRTGML